MRLGVAAAVVDGRVLAGDVEIVDGLVTRVGVHPAGRAGLAVPGFVDLQVNGFAGIDLQSSDPGDYRAIGTALLSTGVTAYQPTFITAPEEHLVAAVGTVADVQRTEQRGDDVLPRLLGAHLEGPFLSPARLGTHPPDPRRDPDIAMMQRILDAGPVTSVTLAPELPGGLGLVDLLVSRGVIASAGHTDADSQTANTAFDRGLRTVTHLFNAMPPMRPREPGVAGAALARDDVTVQIIVDGQHLAPETVQYTWRAARGRCALVTDAIAAAGVGDGMFRLGDVTVDVRGRAARREDSTLAGSTVTMIEAVRNLHELGVDLPEALGAATVVPSGVIGRHDLGRLREEAPADVVVLDDRLEIERVLVGGRQA